MELVSFRRRWPKDRRHQTNAVSGSHHFLRASVRKGRVDRLASLDQALHGCDRFFKHLLFGWIKRNLDNFLDAIGADHHRYPDIKIGDAIFPVELRRASRGIPATVE